MWRRAALSGPDQEFFNRRAMRRPGSARTGVERTRGEHLFSWTIGIGNRREQSRKDSESGSDLRRSKSAAQSQYRQNDDGIGRLSGEVRLGGPVLFNDPKATVVGHDTIANTELSTRLG
jgi:hypothetical protein